MKKFVKILSILMAVALIAAFTAACSAQNETYTFDSITCEGITDKTETEDTYKALFQKDVKFKSDNTYKIGATEGYYKKSGNKIYVGLTADIETDGEPLFTVSGDTLTLVKTFDDGVKVTVTFKRVED